MVVASSSGGPAGTPAALSMMTCWPKSSWGKATRTKKFKEACVYGFVELLFREMLVLEEDKEVEVLKGGHGTGGFVAVSIIQDSLRSTS